MARRALGPATLAVTQAVDALAPAPWLVACSGGADSLALAWAAHHVATRRGTPVRALVVDHGLQPNSDAVAARVVEVLSGLGLGAEVVRVDVVDAGAGPEASARDARYAALEAARRPDERILLGHTLDDQAETVLLRLARGAGVTSLAGIPPERGPFSRPLLGLGREVTVAACAELGLEPWADPMNADHRYARVRVREVVLPVLERELGPGIREALARTATLSREASELVAELAEETDPALATDCLHLLGLAPGLRRRLVADWLRAAGAADVAAVHVDATERLVTHWRGQKGVDVPGGRVSRRDGRLVFEQR
ncbi:tRNA lysidine(34) synthetase TilS [Propioniciclava sp. MC1595]|uniref:tRNA lysidine(34) synthetase TilS n=1 Tax=unclassified Propioniciclava TaxID=2642922 RepID=UPI0016008608|nr:MULTISPECIES: tRNA lysidine(34) synthetase TilS [unclassified Propioniciclava]MBB1495548.1 tRNA lysidine(34) synthetase TilS [Propioniciclava sp. MC1595]MBB1502119.1 tRNA lysidine(34) synthetase TilS [Propioniciclava sp. MC1683]QTE25653.1 tRNA lysidine(34) synthetase TilS [Propioniciclava sp. MC1595]